MSISGSFSGVLPSNASYRPSPSPVPSNYSTATQSIQPVRNLDSAFPPFLPGIPTKSVYERAGFDINRGQHHHRRKKKSKEGRMNSTSSGESTASASTCSGSGSGGSLSKPSPAPTFNSTFSGPNLALHSKNTSITTTSENVSPTNSKFAPQYTIPEIPEPPHSAHSHSHSLPPPPQIVESLPTPPHSSKETHFNLEPEPNMLATKEARQSTASSVYSFSRDPVMDASPSISERPSRNFENQPSVNLETKFNMHNTNNTNTNHQHNDSCSSQESSKPPSLYSASNTATSPTTPVLDLDSGNSSIQSAAPTKQKKICRGCNQRIKGKCVSSKEMSGKWHRACLKCFGCEADFEGIEFYVFKDSPYCQGCYHIENNSICFGCADGIEGECLETVGSGHETLPIRYHMNCLVCAECSIPIMDEYYYDSINSRTLCAQHSKQKAGLERRRTRLLVV